MKKILLSAFFVILFGLGAYYLYQKPTAENSQDETVVMPTSNVINAANFLCAGNKSVQAIFFKDRVELTLSDGRNMLLSQAVSASGARYANTDESFVFWNKGNTAFITEGATTSFQDCAVSAPASKN